MDRLDELLEHIKIPRFVKVGCTFDKKCIEQPAQAMAQELQCSGLLSRIKPGTRICITAGSREVANAAALLGAVVEQVKAAGGEPFLIPAMGSHGGATAEGQLEVLRGYGITEQTVGAPIYSSMDTVEIGVSVDGLPVHMDYFAAQADGIIVVHRIKPHTDFRGKIESGLMKMITIGMGKQHGANICHCAGPARMSHNVVGIARVVLEKKPVLFGIAILENAYHQTCHIEAVAAEDIERREGELLCEAKRLMPRIPFEKADTLIVDEIGKDVTGAGMDPNVTGRSCVLGRWEPNFETIMVRDITEKSHGNGTGLGNADVTTRRAYQKFDMAATYPNCITARDSIGSKIPVVMENDRLALQFALQICFDLDWEAGARIVWIRNTLSLGEYYISEALMEQAAHTEGMTLLSLPMELHFDDEGNFSGLE